MRRNRLIGIVVIALALFAASCAEGPAEDAPPDSVAPETLTGEALRYGISDGTTLVYDMTMSMDMVTDMSGAFVDQGAMGPIEMDMVLAATTAYEVEEGIEEGTYLVSMSFEELSFDSLSMTMGGEDLMDGMDGLLDDSMSAEMAGLSEMKFVIDEQGQMLGVSVDGQSIDFGNLMGGSQFGGLGSGTPFLGPELPEGVVDEGDTWSAMWDTEFVPGKEISVSANSRVVAVEGDVLRHRNRNHDRRDRDDDGRRTRRVEHRRVRHGRAGRHGRHEHDHVHGCQHRHEQGLVRREPRHPRPSRVERRSHHLHGNERRGRIRRHGDGDGLLRNPRAAQLGVRN